MKEEELSVGITGFIDILGFSEKVLSAETIKDIEDISLAIKKIQDEFDFQTNEPLIVEEQKLNKKTILAFSDCIVINIPLQSEGTKYSGTFDPVVSELTNFAVAQGRCVLDSLFIRGGVDSGWWYNQGHTLISQSMVGAVRREESARVPVIALSEGLYNYIKNHEDRKSLAKNIDPLEYLLRKYISGDCEFYYLDYITICLNQFEQESDKINFLSLHAQKIEAGAYLSNVGKVKSKYIWLAEYHNEVALRYTHESKCLCNVI
ncbi:TPA: hypothetical protein ACJIPG_000393 [Escherichia coli]